MFACDDGGAAPGAESDAAGDTSVAAPDTGGATGGTDATSSEDTGTVGTPDVVTPDDELPVPAQGFQIKSTPITVPSGVEGTWCYHFTIPLDEAVGVKRWQSLMTPGSHHLILYFTQEATAPDGTITQDCDGFGDGSITNVPVWTYSAQLSRAEMAMPEGVGMRVGAQQHGFVQMHYLNPTPEDLDVHVTINGDTFSPGDTFVQAAPFITYNTRIEIPAGVGQKASAEGTCRVRDGIEFFALSTHVHKRGVFTEVKDGDTVIFSSEDWEHPGSVRWPEGYTFTGDLSYRCDYENDRDVVVVQGQSAERNEMCMAVGYFFPAQNPILCINSFVVFQ